MASEITELKARVQSAEYNAEQQRGLVEMAQRTLWEQNNLTRSLKAQVATPSVRPVSQSVSHCHTPSMEHMAHVIQSVHCCRSLPSKPISRPPDLELGLELGPGPWLGPGLELGWRRGGGRSWRR